jgi:hypothetical protein
VPAAVLSELLTCSNGMDDDGGTYNWRTALVGCILETHRSYRWLCRLCCSSIVTVASFISFALLIGGGPSLRWSPCSLT